MTRSPNLHQLVMTLGALATVGTLALTVYTTLLPGRANDTVAAMLPPLSAGEGAFIGQSYVGSQVRLFYVAVGLVILMTAVGLAAAFYHFRRLQGRATVSGKPLDWKWALFFLLPPGLFCFLLGLQLPPTIFTPTNLGLLADKSALAAWSAGSVVGGAGLGVFSLLLAVALAAGVFFVMVTLPRKVRTARFERLLG